MSKKWIQKCKKKLPEPCVNLLRPVYHGVRRLSWSGELLKTRVALAMAEREPRFLNPDLLDKLQPNYPYWPNRRYDPITRERSADARAEQIMVMPGAKVARDFLELGCGDGMVSCSLLKRGKAATAVDKTSQDYDPRAAEHGVSFLEADASDLPFKDEQFDYIFSFNAFEHFPDPGKVLDEAIRVLKPGAHLYLEFNPLYFAPYGEHAAISITVPYCQILWEKEVLNRYCAAHQLPLIDFAHVNRWSLDNYRSLWRGKKDVLKRVRYHETYDPAHMDLIRTYPSCFKAKDMPFRNFLVAGISVLFQKR